jgi:hypothetical protein
MLHFLLIILVAVVIWRVLRSGDVSNASMARFARFWLRVALIGVAVILGSALVVAAFVYGKDVGTSELVMAVLGLLFVLGAGWLLFVMSPRAYARAGDPRWYALVMVVPLVNLLAIATLWLKAGYSGRYLLLLFIPFVGWFLMWELAYAAEWPAEREIRINREQSSTPASGNPNVDRFQAWLDQRQ